MRDNRSWRMFRIWWVQRIYEAALILIGTQSLHRAWQNGHDHGTSCEYERLITNKAYIFEAPRKAKTP